MLPEPATWNGYAVQCRKSTWRCPNAVSNDFDEADQGVRERSLFHSVRSISYGRLAVLFAQRHGPVLVSGFFSSVKHNCWRAIPIRYLENRRLIKENRGMWTKKGYLREGLERQVVEVDFLSLFVGG